MAPIGLTRAEIERLDPADACPVAERVEGYWLGDCAQWRRRALRAERELAIVTEALVNALAEARLRKT